MNVFSSAPIRPKYFIRILLKYFGYTGTPKKPRIILFRSGGRGTAIAGLAVDLLEFALGNERLLIGAHPAEGMHQDPAEILWIHGHAEEAQDHPLQVRRTGNRDLGVAADDDGVAVVAGVAPAPHRRLPHDHERGDLIKRAVHPVGPEGRAVPGLVPARVRGGGVKDGVDPERDDRPPCPPKGVPRVAGSEDQGKPDKGVGDGRGVADTLVW